MSNPFFKLILAISSTGAAASGTAGTTTYVGTVEQVSSNSLALKLDRANSVLLDFKCVPDACSLLSDVSRNDRVQATFDESEGTSRALVSVRRCAVPDFACDAAAFGQERELAARLKEITLYPPGEEAERQKLIASFKSDRRELLRLPACEPKRRLLGIKSPEIEGPFPRAPPSPASIEFNVDIGPDGIVRHVAPSLEEYDVAFLARAFYESIKFAEFAEASDHCRQSIVITARFTD